MVYLLPGEVWNLVYCSCYDYSKGGNRRGEGRKDTICKKMLIIFLFLYNMGGCITKYKLIEKEILGERSIAK